MAGWGVLITTSPMDLAPKGPVFSYEGTSSTSMRPMSCLVGILYCRNEFSASCPFSSYVTDSVRAMPMPWRMPPSACTLVSAGSRDVPQSTAATNRCTFVSPVLRSTKSSTAPAMNGGGEIFELLEAVTSSAPTSPHWARKERSERVMLSPSGDFRIVPS